MGKISEFNISGDPAKDREIKIWLKDKKEYLSIDKSTGNILNGRGVNIGYVSRDGYINLYGEYRAGEDSIHGDYIPDYDPDSWKRSGYEDEDEDE